MRTRSVGVLILEKNTVLLVKHGSKAKHLNDSYGFPAGRVDSGETDKQTAVRELFEETGLLASETDLVEFPGNYVESTLQMKSGPEDFTFIVFLAKRYAGQLKGSEETVPEWIDVEQIKKLNTLPNVENIIKNGQEFLTNP